MRTTPVLLLASASLMLMACGGDDSSGSGTPATLEVAELQEAIESGDTEALEESLDEMRENLDELVSSFGGDGGGTVTVDGVTYTVEADLCIVDSTEFNLDGPATGSDGSVAWVSVDYGLTARADVEGVLDEGFIDMMFPPGVDTIEDMNVSVGVGQTSRFESVDDQPSWSAMGGSAAMTELTYERSGNSVRGSGEAQDFNFIATDFGEFVPIEFDVSCD